MQKVAVMQVEGMVRDLPELQSVGRREEESALSWPSIVAVRPSLLLQATGMKVADASLLFPAARGECHVIHDREWMMRRNPFHSQRSCWAISLCISDSVQRMLRVVTCASLR